MELDLMGALQLVGFLLVGVIILIALVSAAIGGMVFLYMTNRKGVVVKNAKDAFHPHDSGVSAGARP